MGVTAGGCHDLRSYQDEAQMADLFGKVVSRKLGYKATIEKKVEVKKCAKCGRRLEGNEKFCPECGEKTEWQKAAEKPVVLLTLEQLESKFKSGGEKESDITAYIRDVLNMGSVSAFDIVNKWRKEINEIKISESPKIDLSKFKG